MMPWAAIYACSICFSCSSSVSPPAAAGASPAAPPGAGAHGYTPSAQLWRYPDSPAEAKLVYKMNTLTLLANTIEALSQLNAQYAAGLAPAAADAVGLAGLVMPGGRGLDRRRRWEAPAAGPLPGLPGARPNRILPLSPRRPATPPAPALNPGPSSPPTRRPKCWTALSTATTRTI